MNEAKRKAGRPRIMPKGSKRLTVSLGVEDYARAELIGNGNVSEGIRRALKISAELGTDTAEHAHSAAALPGSEPALD